MQLVERQVNREMSTDVSRTSFAIKVVVSTLLMLGALAATAALGAWQYSNAYRDDRIQSVLNAEPQEISEISVLGEYLDENYYGQSVVQSGELTCARGFIVNFENEIPSWVVCEFIYDDDQRIAVALGESDVVPQDFASTVTLSGRIQPAQDTSQISPLKQPTEVVNFINTDELVNRWQSDVHDGYVVLEEIVDERGVLVSVPATQLKSEALVFPPVGIELRNLFYAWQWWFFAAFAIFLWAKYLRDEIAAKNAVEIND